MSEPLTSSFWTSLYLIRFISVINTIKSQSYEVVDVLLNRATTTINGDFIVKPLPRLPTLWTVVVPPDIRRKETHYASSVRSHYNIIPLNLKILQDLPRYVSRLEFRKSPIRLAYHHCLWNIFIIVQQAEQICSAQLAFLITFVQVRLNLLISINVSARKIIPVIE